MKAGSIYDTFMKSITTEMNGKYLTFWVNNQLFGIPISAVSQVIGIQAITKVPVTPKEVINLHDSSIPLIDVRLLFGIEEMEYNSHTCVIIIHLDKTEIGLAVDAVDEVKEVINITNENMSPTPRTGNSLTNHFLKNIVYPEQATADSDKKIKCIDVTKVFEGYRKYQLNCSE